MPDDAVTEEALIQQGKPFHLILGAAGLAVTTFNLDTGTYDATAGYFSDLPADWNHKRDMMLWVGAIHIYPEYFIALAPRNPPDIVPVVDALRFDGVAVWFGAVQPSGQYQTLDLRGESMMYVNPVSLNYPEVGTVETKYGVKFHPVRNTITFSQLVDGWSDALKIPIGSRVELWGVYTPRTG